MLMDTCVYITPAWRGANVLRWVLRLAIALDYGRPALVSAAIFAGTLYALSGV
ncbi:hypothetical protein [Gluconobacter cerinus]|uniref:hypothetical protein n=1 Tax=Gluconobacter cerinus TaxID=38307 RepID=UPI003AB64DB8